MSAEMMIVADASKERIDFCVRIGPSFSEEGRCRSASLRFKPFDQRNLVSLLVVMELVNKSLREHDAEAPFADAQLVANVEVTDRVLLRRGVGNLSRVEARPLVEDDQRHGL